MKTLLHTCCGPCASACVPRLKEMDREVTLLFANSNIDTREEFEKRLCEAEKLAEADGVKLVALPYDHEEWLREVAAGYESEPEKGARCTRCFRYNLAKAATYAAAHGYDEFTTSLTVSPHKVTKTIFNIAQSLFPVPRSPFPVPRSPFPVPSSPFPVPSSPSFLPIDFKKREGFKLSTRRAAELGLYRQAYCGCEFSKWRIHHKAETVSTNLDARAGSHGDVFTADFQTAGRGRLDHKWLSPPGTNLMMSAVLSVAGLPPEQVATLPLVVGLAVTRAVSRLLELDVRRETEDASEGLGLKWPNDVLVGGKKLAGILCERNGDNVIVGIGLNVGQTDFAPEIATRATSLAILAKSSAPSPLPAQIRENPCQSVVFNSPLPTPQSVRNAILGQLARCYAIWKAQGFAAVYPVLREVDVLKGRTLSVRQTDDDAAPISGLSNGIMPDGSLDVGGNRVYAGEAHIEKVAT